MVREFYTLYIAILLVVVVLKPSSSINISPDSQRLYHDIVSGNGLYNGFSKLTELGGSNFKNIVFSEQKHRLWLVEFYNSWCGHCHRFAPTWKALGSDVYEWRDVVGVGAVDCANDGNNQLCRDMEVMYYPMIKVFPPNSDEKFLGDAFQKGTVEEMRTNLVIHLKSIQKSHEKNKAVNLNPLSDSSLDTLWTDVPSDVRFLALVFEPEDSIIGSEVALDLSKTKELQTRLVNPSNEQLGQVVRVEQGGSGVVIVDKDEKITKLESEEFTREKVNKALRQFLVNNSVDVPLELPVPEVIAAPEVEIADVMQTMQLEEEIKKKLHTTALSTVVFQVDLEGAIRYSLKNEVSLHRNISGDSLIALKNYMEVLVKYFPFGQRGTSFLKHLKEKGLDGKTEVSGKEFRHIFLQLEDRFKPFLQKQGWLGCRGSQPAFRGYPCSLWTMFHTLTVHEEAENRNTTGAKPEVVHAMAGYIRNFFTCSDCAAHFTEMAKTIAGNVTTQNDSILWLWAAHNNVNKRLAGDQTEDPKHKKIQFPTVEACPTCYSNDSSASSWNNSEVIKFLKNMYTNIIYLQEDDLTTTSTTTPPSTSLAYDRSLRDGIYGEEQGYSNKLLDDVNKRSLWGFNIFDISICVFLYICSVGILILVCIKFVFKRSFRKRTHAHDAFNKV